MNPFAIPSDARLRMAITAVTAVAYCVFFGFLIAPAGFVERITRCESTPGYQVDPAAVPAENLRRLQALASCIAPGERQAGWELFGGLALLALALAGYLGASGQRQRIKKLSSLSGPTADRVRELGEAVGLPKIPRILFDPSDRAVASVFGSKGEPVLDVGMRAITTYSHDPPAGDAIILHELAHIANGDIRRTQFAEALFRTIGIIGAAFVPVGIAAMLVEGVPAATALGFGEHAVALLAVYYLAHRAYTRNRELHADFRAQLWSANDGTLASALRQEFRSTSGKQGRWNPIRLARAASAMHPPVRRRLDSLSNPGALIQFTAGAAAFSGVAAGMLAALAGLILTLTTAGTVLSADVGALSGAAAGCLLGLCMAAGLARNAYIRAATGDTARPAIARRANANPAVLALAAAAGVVIGGFLPFNIAPSGPAWSPDLQLSWQVAALLAGTLAAASLWTVGCLGLAFKRHGADGATRLYRVALVTGVIGFGLALAVVYGLSYSLKVLAGAAADQGIWRFPAHLPSERQLTTSYLDSVLRGPLTYVLLLALALTLPWMLSRGRATTAGQHVQGRGHGLGVSPITITPPSAAIADYKPSAATPVKNRDAGKPAAAPRRIAPGRREAAGSVLVLGLVGFLLAHRYGLTPGAAGLLVGCVAVAVLSLRIEARAGISPAWTVATYGAITCCLAGTLAVRSPGFDPTTPGPFVRWLLLAAAGVAAAYRQRARTGANLDSLLLFMALLFALGIRQEGLGLAAWLVAVLVEGFCTRYTAIWGVNSLTGALVLTLIVPPYFHGVPAQIGALLAATIACPLILLSWPVRKILGVTITPPRKPALARSRHRGQAPSPVPQTGAPSAAQARAARVPASETAQKTTPAERRDLSQIPLSDITERALAAAARAATANGTLLDTTGLLLQLMRLDMKARWNRIFLTTGDLYSLDARRIPDEMARSRFWHEGAQLTIACARAVLAAEDTRRRYGFESLAEGVLALCLVADPGNGAARTLGIPEKISHEELSDKIQRDIIGSMLTGPRQVPGSLP